MKQRVYDLLEDMKTHAPQEPIINSRDRQLHILVQMSQLLVLIAEEMLEKPEKDIEQKEVPQVSPEMIPIPAEEEVYF